MKTLEEAADETKWWDEVQAYSKIIDYEVSEEMRQEFLASYFIDGYTPKQAVDEDLSYCD